jgi:signal peptide peptidase SppA
MSFPFLSSAFNAGEPLLIRSENAISAWEKANNVLETARLFAPKNAENTTENSGFLAINALKAVLGERPKSERKGKTMFIPIDGPIGYKITPLDRALGACDAEDVAQAFEAAEADPNVERIVFDINSPGGTVRGIPELADAIANSKKHTTAFTDTHAESSAYWIASQCREVVATPGASVGSVGVFMVVPDYSKKAENEGIKMRVFKAGKHKAAGLIGTSLTPEQEAKMDADCSDLWQDFKGAVKGKRTLVRDEDLEGQSFIARKAAQRGLITGIAKSRSQFMSRFTQLT